MSHDAAPEPTPHSGPHSGADASGSGPISTVLDRLDEAATHDRPSAGEIVEAVGRQSHVTLLLVPALVVMTPLSGIPLLSSVCGLIIALVSLAGLLGRDRIWLPGFVTRRRVDGDRLGEAVAWLRKPVGWIERHTRRRLPRLVSPPADRAILLLCLLCGLAMPALELVPFTSSVLGGAVALLAISLIVRDGLFASLAFAVIALVLAAPVLFFTSGGA
ncbi:exopolysaccharide biosynthesis protein [Albimonas sp. CAU 1670]|uniref:exopolysaccharide biosynthesis protein n=1 Tax=Albimonas sp. CAU 1670 TaxID=3032599 RepID=UPI0023D98150|nr:exopolysaccharide biosynthesis protein [Albimonas sp. CAU 1670]MDF2231436.1 exopolysaccharide biosynthesis protein [Albimonas sp. CAU 1670]